MKSNKIYPVYNGTSWQLTIDGFIILFNSRQAANDEANFINELNRISARPSEPYGL